MQECNVMVCVTGQKNCARLIREGAQLARRHNGRVQVIHVATQSSAFLCSDSAQEAEALEYLFRCAQSCGADMSVLRAGDVLEMLARFARKNAITCVVLGVGPGRGAMDFAQQLGALLPQVDIHPIYAEEE